MTNIEGMITRFKDATKQALNLFSDETSQENAKIVLEKLDNLINGTQEATLIILDPFGQSNVVSDNVKIEKIPEKELEELKTGFSLIEDR